MKQQDELFEDILPPHLAAAKADVDAIADNYKEAAAFIWPGDPLKGAKRLSNALNVGQLQKLELKELKDIADAACLKAGKSHITAYLTHEQPCDLKWVPREVMVERAKVEISELATKLDNVMSRASKWLVTTK